TINEIDTVGNHDKFTQQFVIHHHNNLYFIKSYVEMAAFSLVIYLRASFRSRMKPHSPLFYKGYFILC
ncbi:MAG: hypothetical protein V3T40_03145, partial [Nitrososphaerales archaeon]